MKKLLKLGLAASILMAALSSPKAEASGCYLKECKMVTVCFIWCFTYEECTIKGDVKCPVAEK